MAGVKLGRDMLLKRGACFLLGLSLCGITQLQPSASWQSAGRVRRPSRPDITCPFGLCVLCVPWTGAWIWAPASGSSQRSVVSAHMTGPVTIFGGAWGKRKAWPASSSCHRGVRWSGLSIELAFHG
ncbi:uncharacterized protein LY79DRAFT_546842 [Colletotrichum navitas]|uniref:Uncharacterized protein n=1 Tax=Colletotrichum navitas TaxID=681940 RepID=A0AAD8V8M3_9PEZI|nr:uncharacterized protein LY79DRAFT_546842 [Colletotrichum navitas]KAK1595595.1 hypothetical protein LY79DRAFT_546842 [Colletotrichum navitas]